MGLVVVTPAAIADIVPLADAKAHMNVSTVADDALISRLIRTAIAKLDGERGSLGRCIAPTVLRWSASVFFDSMDLPLPPVTAVEEVAYVDALGMPRIMDADGYRAAGLGEDDGATILRAPGTVWPATAGGPDAVRITFTAGYETMPEPLVSAILMHVAHLYENREASLVGINAQILPMGYDELVGPYARWAC